MDLHRSDGPWSSLHGGGHGRPTTGPSTQPRPGAGLEEVLVRAAGGAGVVQAREEQERRLQSRGEDQEAEQGQEREADRCRATRACWCCCSGCRWTAPSCWRRGCGCNTEHRGIDQVRQGRSGHLELHGGDTGKASAHRSAGDQKAADALRRGGRVASREATLQQAGAVHDETQQGADR